MDSLQLSDYAERYVVDRLSSIDGVAQVRIGGQQRYAMRVWLDRDALAARGADRRATSRTRCSARTSSCPPAASNRPSATSRCASRAITRSRRTSRRSRSARVADGYVVRLGDVAKVELASAERRAYFRSNGETNIGLGIVKTSTANSLDVARAVRAEAERIAPSLPAGHEDLRRLRYDRPSSTPSVERVYHTLVEAIVLVLIVIWLFLGSVRAALIPAVTVPVCLIAAFMPLYAVRLFDQPADAAGAGAVHRPGRRRCDRRAGEHPAPRRPGRAASSSPPRAARDRWPSRCIATTAVLVAVFLPIGFMEGNTGRLFRELSVALAGAVALSAFVALTLTPMMSSKLVRPHSEEKGNPVHRWVNKRLDWVTARYRRFLEGNVERPTVLRR